MSIHTKTRDSLSSDRDLFAQQLENVSTGVGWSSVKVLAAYYDCSEKAIWERSRNGKLPKPKKLGHRNTRWSNAEILKHDQELNNLERYQLLEALYV
jgi:predicted DNA-binding transcriptional regulator AlpA